MNGPDVYAHFFFAYILVKTSALHKADFLMMRVIRVQYINSLFKGQYMIGQLSVKSSICMGFFQRPGI